MSTAAQKARRSAARGNPFESLEAALFPQGYKLVVGTSQIYELELAAAESRALGRPEIVERGAYFDSVDGAKTNHFRMCAVSPLQVDAASSTRRKSFFEANLFKTGYATHGLFPYRGKFHPQMIKAVINIIGLKRGETLLDPMMGSGTACLEASLQGANAIGIDASPFCALMAEGKQAGASADGAQAEALFADADAICDRFEKSQPEPPLFRTNNSARRAAALEKGWDAFLRLCYLDAMGYAARRARKSVRELFPVVLQRYVAAVRNFARIRDELRLKLGSTSYLSGDARDLKACKLEDDSIDGIVTSPPYSFAIDYVANDAAQLEYLEVEVERLRGRMIGLRGGNLAARVQNYLADMGTVTRECARVLRKGRYFVVVVGTNSNQLKRVMGTNGEDLQIDREIVRIGEDAGFELVRDVIHPIEGIRNTLRDEHILFLRKK
ncbi:MAG: hypothetical protein HYS13_06440 [Planctomycetia bacterium]|nr:hypothetical protein [Planctomycetia bacterium]